MKVGKKKQNDNIYGNETSINVTGCVFVYVFTKISCKWLYSFNFKVPGWFLPNLEEDTSTLPRQITAPHKY